MCKLQLEQVLHLSKHIPQQWLSLVHVTHRMLSFPTEEGKWSFFTETPGMGDIEGIEVEGKGSDSVLRE